MSQFSTMTTRERKMQAAAICREVQAQEDIEMDLGKKMSVPKDIMLEELSLTSNRGSQLFKKRQRRSEKYTFESIQNANNNTLSGEVDLQSENGNISEGNSGFTDTNPPEVTFDTESTKTVPDPDSIAPGYGGPLKDIPPEKFNSTSVPKSYHSPWEQAIISDPGLADTLNTCMAELVPKPDLPGYKSFNRVAIPFGGFANAPRSSPVKAIQVENLSLQEPLADAGIDRCSFNRSALGWVPGCPFSIHTFHNEADPVPESDDL
ncbi:myozenin-2a [Gouania willdenowi]|uniref:Myozenin-2-like n=1 Tax=Gouania willdenowi TaxID=441366 RepID=A0A8C5I525_GOUWI|nr:myozenin-2-like [Gouania willdenowi]